jgi:hypothetical protein
MGMEREIQMERTVSGDIESCSANGFLEGDWHAINWIDSKAQFCDRETHEQNREQVSRQHHKHHSSMSSIISTTHKC